MPENTRIEKTFTYDLPDQYLYQTNKLKLTAEWTYTGPDKLWIFIDKDTRKIDSRLHYTERDNGNDVPTPDGKIKVLVDAAVNPDIASLIHNELDYGSLPHSEEVLPDGSTYRHPIPSPPDHCYELTEITYDTEKNKFNKPYPWKQPHIDFATILNSVRSFLPSTDAAIVTCSPNKLEAWKEYRQWIRDFPETYKNVDPWKIPFKPNPDMLPDEVMQPPTE